MVPNSEPLVSVVTPVYNGEKYIRECIESVLAQTYSNWDYVIVDNCSTDRTLEIAQEYAAKDPRIRIHNNSAFVGVDANHNNAFRQISPDSRFCKVVAADDWIFPECLEKMVGLAVKYPSVAIVQAYRQRGNWVAGDGLPYPATFMRGPDVCRTWLLPGRPSIFGAPTTLMYRSDIVRSRESFYDESNLAADTEVCLAFLADNDYGFIHQVLTFHRLRRASTTGDRQRLQVDFPCRLYELVTFGPRYLAPNELDEAMRHHLHEYYRTLGSLILRRRSRAFWSFHRARLRELGYPLSVGRLVRAAIVYWIGVLVNPGRTAERLAERRRRERESYLFE
jgi:glycosyltransferase involved in cell wall biosynthesis